MPKKSSGKRAKKAYEVEVCSSVETGAANSRPVVLEEEPVVEEPKLEEIKVEVPEEPKAPKERYFVCPFCLLEGKEISGRDPVSTWCPRCGKCFLALWKER